MDPIIRLAPRYRDRFDASSPALKRIALSEVHNFVRRYREDPRRVAWQYERLERIADRTILELELGAGHRILADWTPGTLTLLDIGGHEVLSRYRSDIRQEVAAAELAGGDYWPETCVIRGFFASHPDRERTVFANELDPGWVYYLTDQQRGIIAAIIRATKSTTVANPRRYFIVGGPGTGKTTILVRLLIDLTEHGLRPGLIVSDRVAEYLESGGGISLASARMRPEDLICGAEASRFDVALIDDPQGIGEIDATFSAAQGCFRCVVIAFDPCQLEAHEDLSDEVYDLLVRFWDVKAYQLRACYRQKENLGRAALRVIEHVARSSPFLRKDRIEAFRASHDVVYRLANTLTFPNKHGYEETYPTATLEDVRRELKRIRSAPLWRHTPPILLVLQTGLQSDDWNWDGLLRGLSYVKVLLTADEYGHLGEVKGLEFQHAILVIGRSLYDELQNGFIGTGRPRYHRRRLLRIPFSRAKDSMVTFAVAEKPSTPVRR